MMKIHITISSNYKEIPEIKQIVFRNYKIDDKCYVSIALRQFWEKARNMERNVNKKDTKGT